MGCSLHGHVFVMITSLQLLSVSNGWCKESRLYFQCFQLSEKMVLICLCEYISFLLNHINSNLHLPHLYIHMLIVLDRVISCKNLCLKKTCLCGFCHKPDCTTIENGWLEAQNFGFKKKRDCTIYVGKQKH